MNTIIMALRFTLEAKRRMVERLSISIGSESEVIADIVKYRKNTQYSKAYKQFTVHGNRWRYIIDENWNIVTIMKRVKDDNPELVEKNKIGQDFVHLSNCEEQQELLSKLIFWDEL